MMLTSLFKKEKISPSSQRLAPPAHPFPQTWIDVKDSTAPTSVTSPSAKPQGMFEGLEVQVTPSGSSSRSPVSSPPPPSTPARSVGSSSATTADMFRFVVA